MADKYLNKTVARYWYNRMKTVFAAVTDLNALSTKVDEIIAEGGEPNKIDTISVNGTNVPPDAQKNVALTIPTKTSDITNDGDGTSDFATEAYVDQNGGKIDVIKVNGTTQTITNKTVDIEVPIATSDLTNDSGFIDNTVNNLTNYYLKTETYTKEEVDDLVEAAIAGGFVLVQTLPEPSASTMYKIYLVPNQGEGQDTKDEFITIQEGSTYSWEKIGNTNINLEDYWAKDELTAITTADIDEIMGESESE